MKRVVMLIVGIMLCLTVNVGAYKADKSVDIYMAQNITVDGKLDDWDKYKYSYIIMPEEEKQVSFFASYEGPDDLSAVIWFAWSNDGLYMAARIEDNIKNTIQGSGYWKGDSLQFAGGIGNVYGPEIGLSDEGIVRCEKPGGAVSSYENIDFTVGKDGEADVYEVYFPWETLGSGKPDDIFPFCICINENEGDGRKGWIETAAGLSSSKVANDFSVLKLVQKIPEENTGDPVRPEIKDITEKENSEKQEQTIVYEIKTHITFPDIRFHWARTAIDNMASRGIVRGYGEFYYPALNINRAEFIATLVRAVGLDPVSYQGGFGDISADYWCADYIQAAIEGELLPDEFFVDRLIKPEELVKREEMIALFCNAVTKRKNINLTQDELGYSDCNLISAWAMPYIRGAQHYGLISGNESNMICPQNLATRAEVAVLANLFVEITQ